MLRTCPVCGKVLDNKLRRKWCSDECKYKKKTYKKECVHCGRVFSTDNQRRLYCSSECRQEASEMSSGKKSICWTCQNFAGGCSWSRYFIPIEGWEAKPIKKSGTYLPSYIVKQCPEYIKDLPRRIK